MEIPIIQIGLTVLGMIVTGTIAFIVVRQEVKAQKELRERDREDYLREKVEDRQEHLRQIKDLKEDYEKKLILVRDDARRDRKEMKEEFKEDLGRVEQRLTKHTDNGVQVVAKLSEVEAISHQTMVSTASINDRMNSFFQNIQGMVTQK